MLIELHEGSFNMRVALITYLTFTITAKKVLDR